MKNYAMSRRESLSRYNLIIKKLRQAPTTYAEIAEILKMESELQGYDLTVSKRTFQRDLDEIRSLYSIDIEYDFSRRLYLISMDQQNDVSERILESFDIFNALNLNKRLSDYIHFEKRRPGGTENLYGLLHAVRNRLSISFTYRKFWDNEVSERIVEPYALKESGNRWYLLANDMKDNHIKCFGLDRLTGLAITKKKFEMPGDFDVNAYFKNCFGVIMPDDEDAQEVVLSFEPLQGRYIKSLPLHESQEILQDNEKELLIRLRLFLTHDFLMELLSYGESVKVVIPESLAADIKESYVNALKNY